MGIRVSNVTAQVLTDPSEVSRSVEDTISFVEEPFARKIRVASFAIQVLQLQPQSPWPNRDVFADTQLKSWNGFFDNSSPTS